MSTYKTQDTVHYALPDPDCYIYLHHVKKYIILPSYAEAASDGIQVSFTPSTPLMRTAPIYSYQNSGPRTLSVTLELHRDMINELNVNNESDMKETENVYNVNTKTNQVYNDYVDKAAKWIQAAALPTYSASSKMVNPPMVSLKLGNDIFIKGVVQGSVNVSYGLPILANGKYARVTIQFSVTEVVPYDADTVMQVGSYRGMSSDLTRSRTYTAGSSKS